MTKLIAAGMIALMAAATAACGRMADLEAPPAKKAERSMRDGRAPGLPEPASTYRRPMEQPIEGAGGNPYSGSGAYPSPPR